MKHLILLSILLASPVAGSITGQEEAASPAPAEDAIMLRLRDGGILWGSIVGHDEESITFHRLDNGGTVKLRWPFLDPREEEGLRLRFGYVESGVEELMVDADRLTLVDGTELVGLITERTADKLWLKTAEQRIPIPLARIAGPATIVQVPAFDIYTRDELYQKKITEMQSALMIEGPEAASAHFEVAQYAEALFDYEHAVEHYEACVRLDPEYQAESIDAILARAIEKRALQEQVDHIRQIDIWRARRHYDKAEEAIASFPTSYPDSPLMDDWNKMRDRVAKQQERDLREKVVRSWHHWTRRFAQTAARKMSYEEVMGYLDGGMSEDILTKVHEDMTEIAPDIQTDEVKRLFQEREGGKFRQASYGNGTWLLGETAARAQLEEPEKETDEPKDSAAAARKKLDDKIKRYLKNQELAKKAKAGAATDEEDPGAFWEGWPSSNRVYWVLAYYAENSGDLQVNKIRFRSCRECGGKGVRQVIFTGGAVSGAKTGEVLVPCPTCKTIAVVRMVRYR